MRYYIIAGEASGDLHGAYLIKAIREQDPAAVFRFWGGDKMVAEAGTPVRHISTLAIMGFIEVAAHLKTVLGNISFCKRDILQYNPDVVIGIDYPGFNLKIERWAHQHGIKAVHYISPNLWAWKKGRLKGMKQYLDQLYYILPFEQAFFKQNNVGQALYVGHPLLDEIKQGEWTPTAIHSKANSPIIALLPGSRKQELKSSLPIMAQLAHHYPNYHFVVAGMSLLGNALYDSLIPRLPNLEVRYNQTYSILSQAYAAIVCSGTATLETALFNVPQVVCYRGNPLSYCIARAVVGRRIRHISLVDLIMDDDVVVELLQSDFNYARLEQEFNRITTDHPNRNRILQQYADLRNSLGDGGASEKTAQAIIRLIS